LAPIGGKISIIFLSSPFVQTSFQFLNIWLFSENSKNSWRLAPPPRHNDSSRIPGVRFVDAASEADLRLSDVRSRRDQTTGRYDRFSRSLIFPVEFNQSHFVYYSCSSIFSSFAFLQNKTIFEFKVKDCLYPWTSIVAEM